MADAVQPSPGLPQRAAAVIAKHEAEIKPLEIEAARCWWAANVSGSEEAYKKKEALETQLELKLADARTFAELKELRAGGLADPLLSRQVQLLYLMYLPRQIDPKLLAEMIRLSNKLEKAFNAYRPQVDGKELTDNQVRKILRESTSSNQRRAAWESSKGIGPIVEADLKQLVNLRNEAARKLGFRDYHVMQLSLNEQKQEDVLRLFDELDLLTRDAFRQAKSEIDALLAKNYKVEVGQLRPWHYHDPFFQESPDLFGADSRQVYDAIDIVKTCRAFYAGIGLPVDDVLARSDLYEKKGKNPHAFCTDIDRSGDVRVLCNIVPGEEWLSTLLHELGHSVYSSKNIPASLPYLLRTDAHALCTEGVAMMYERFAAKAKWLEAMGAKVPDPQAFDAAAAKRRRNQLLIFSRWCQVMLRFEKELYGNPDQDLNRRWWDLVEKYQEVRRPEGRNAPDYAAKIHIIVAPVYYHNYMLGQLFAAQVHAALVRQVFGGEDPVHVIYSSDAQAGRFMQEKVFAPGRSLPWNELTKHATGEPLNPKALAVELQAK
jgi:peptidyl-dipeptidase A